MAFSLRLASDFSEISRRPSRLQRARRGFADARTGAAAVEFAVIGPVLVAMLMGIATYGSYFLAAHTVQQLANDAARAAIAGLDDDERTELAQESVAEGMAGQTFMRGELSGVDVTRTDDSIAVRVTYDASADVWTHMLAPVPSTVIARTATIRLGGY